MEKGRDVSVKMIADTDAKSIPSTSPITQSYDKRREKYIFENQSAILPLILEAINETTAEKNVQAKEVSELLSLLEINPKSMPKDIQDLWDKVALVIQAEGLSSMNEMILMLHMQRKKKECMKKIRKDQQLKGKFNSLENSDTNLLKKNSCAQKSIDLLQKIIEDEVMNNEQRVNTMVNAVKLNDYKEVVEKIDESLTELGATNYFPENLLEKHKTYLELKEELNRTEQSLCKYNDLPPNIIEARFKLAEKEKYLNDLEHTIFERMK